MNAFTPTIRDSRQIQSCIHSRGGFKLFRPPIFLSNFPCPFDWKGKFIAVFTPIVKGIRVRSSCPTFRNFLLKGKYSECIHSNNWEFKEVIRVNLPLPIFLSNFRWLCQFYRRANTMNAFTPTIRDSKQIHWCIHSRKETLVALDMLLKRNLGSLDLSDLLVQLSVFVWSKGQIQWMYSLRS